MNVIFQSAKHSFAKHSEADMQLNLSTDIALRTLIFLGEKGGTATIAEISEAFAIARTHLMKVVMTLVAENLITSERGRNGGIRLARPPAEITVGEVVRVMEKISRCCTACGRK
jgi:Rrf2 family nitric oxide-sensitive transcriptional repressor